MYHIIKSFIIDILLVNSGFLIAIFVRFSERYNHFSFQIYLETAPYIMAIHFFSFFLYDLSPKRFTSFWSLLRKVFWGILLGTGLSMCFIYIFRGRWGNFPSGVFLMACVFNIIIITFLKYFFYKSANRIYERIQFAGTHEVDKLLLSKDLQDLDEIVLTSEINDIRSLFLLMGVTRDLGIRLSISQELYEQLLYHKIHNELPVYFLMPVYLSSLSSLEEFLIRAVDVIVSLSLLIVFAPICLIIAIIIKITSKGPVIYKQNRLGLHGKVFTIYKFRTMREGAEQATGPMLTYQGDPRVTNIGKLLRKTRIDELPQIINVLKGEMSLVGPRPERLHFIRQHQVLSGIRLSVKPGITGLAQVRKSYDLKPEYKLRYDYLYITKRSLVLNIKIILRTIPVMIFGKGT
ncbi:exopolysaccharide biosynthesis polyprenyl glycosylphosphotransferase [Candidatus Omnitrophus magneticus]|uniref:Exopolysaccharide biosynthesis polyprenyl glycosylphosphotransferase n=1 Tax=Candidatus Omnitrophus magneticus TaxID=1609969 RepID=A0A0F0CVV5_9BACT|nr:exopolysaccharide biosynthesis polyprenyl glycosylphosphotransferase [Candidatus Omnitrophus magneticus]